MLAVDVVTADGELVRADADENADLYWAARGAGPGFPGVVTRFHLRTYPRVPMFHDTRIFRLDDLEPMLEWLHAVLPRLDRAVEPVIAPRRACARGEARAPAAHHARRRRREARPIVCWRRLDDVAGRAGRATSAGRRRSPRRTRRRRCRTRRATATAPTASGRTLRPPNSRRCCARLWRSCPPGTRSRSGTAGRRPATLPTWRSRSRPTSTWPTYGDLGRPGRGRAQRAGCTASHAAARRAGGARGSTSATPTSPAGPTASWPPANLAACSAICAARDPEGRLRPSYLGSLMEDQAAVHVQRLPGDRRGRVGAQERDGAGDVARARAQRGTA